MANDMNLRRKLTDDVNISTMLSMRRDGMTNKQIAYALGVSPTTIYKYIGRMSDAVKVAQMQNRPAGSIIPRQQWETSTSAESSPEKKDQDPQIRRKPPHQDVQAVQPDDETHVILNGTTFSVYQPQQKAKKAEEEKPVPITEEQAQAKAEDKRVEEMPKEQKKSMLRVVSTRSTLQGNLCKYIVDTESDSIEIDGGGVLTGILDKKTLDEIIQELSEIRSMFTTN